jgi:hypothetical protein
MKGLYAQKPQGWSRLDTLKRDELLIEMNDLRTHMSLSCGYMILVVCIDYSLYTILPMEKTRISENEIVCFRDKTYQLCSGRLRVIPRQLIVTQYGRQGRPDNY